MFQKKKRWHEMYIFHAFQPHYQDPRLPDLPKINEWPPLYKKKHTCNTSAQARRFVNIQTFKKALQFAGKGEGRITTSPISSFTE
mmetsp:Transcript_24321/g.32413  ORF Transcript_24321/g.32413 Transcript_24321/m.32413 type:complete len:85 (+) Transcript_24321:88-342(+)